MLRRRNYEEQDSGKVENRGGSRPGSGRNLKASISMLEDDIDDDNSVSSSDNYGVSAASASATRRHASKREITRLLAIEQETCRTFGSGLTVETCLIVISIFTQRIREAISVKGVDDILFGAVIDFEKDPPYRYYSQIAKEFHMRSDRVQSIIEIVINCEPDELRQRLRDWLELRIGHAHGTAPKSEFNMALHLAAFYEVIEELVKDEIYISARNDRITFWR